MDIGQINMLGQSSKINKMKELKDMTHGEKEDKKLLDASREFEAVLLNEMLSSMRKTLPGDSIFSSGYSGDMYQSMYDDYLTQEISKGGKGIGLAEILYDQVSRREDAKK